jgi:hypothetical protein
VVYPVIDESNTWWRVGATPQATHADAVASMMLANPKLAHEGKGEEASRAMQESV